MSPGLGGRQNLFVCFFVGSFLMGEKTHKQSPPPKIPGRSRETFVYLFFFLYMFFFFFRSQVGVLRPRFLSVLSAWALQIPSNTACLATPPAPYRNLPGPPGPESRKSRKRVSKQSPESQLETWAIAVRRGSYRSLFLLNSGQFFPREEGKINSELRFA